MSVFAFYAIAKGVQTEPNLAHLREASDGKKRFQLKSRPFILIVSMASLLIPLILYGIFRYFTNIREESALSVISYIASILEGISILFILYTIAFQVRRYLTESDDPAVRRQNLYPLLGYLYLLARGISLVLYRLPDLDIVIFRKLSLSYGATWQLSILFSLGAFVLLGLWAWNFIKVRFTLRTFTLFFAIVILVSSLGSLFYTLLIFRVVEQNNLDLMMRAVRSQEFILNDRADQSLLVARTVANDDDVIAMYSSNDYYGLLEEAEKYLSSTGIDILRIYTTYSEIYVSANDPRDKGRVLRDDTNLAFTLKQRQHLKTFDTQPGILSDVLVTRAIHPIIVNGEIIGAVEAGYVFDNAFVDFSKAQTNLDITIFTYKTRSATTLKTKDEVSRWTGSQVTNIDVINTVLENGESIMTSEKHLEEDYYAAYVPVRKVNGDIIGMISVGTPVFQLIEDTRQQLISAFLIITVISLLGSASGYYVIRSFSRSIEPDQSVKEKTT